MLKLPRQVETDPKREAIEKLLASDQRTLWSEGALKVPYVPFSPAFEQALVWVLRSRQVERGLENIEMVLEKEGKGLAALRVRQGTEVSNRISRLLVIADDGSERFFRQCEGILMHHGDRVLGLRVGVPSTRFSEKMFGADKLVKVLLVSEKDAVSRVLLALAAA